MKEPDQQTSIKVASNSEHWGDMHTFISPPNFVGFRNETFLIVCRAEGSDSPPSLVIDLPFWHHNINKQFYAVFSKFSMKISDPLLRPPPQASNKLGQLLTAKTSF